MRSINDAGLNMTSYQLMCWQNIPAVVEARAEGKLHKQPLSSRFQELIDLLAMKQGLAGSDAYLDQWKKTAPEKRAGSPMEVAKAVAAEIEARFDQLRAEALASSSRRQTPGE
ncbi:MAG: hypothetical protein D4R74_12005 [Betaproteobacteria bacterium]|nr:MAG: hypothetical protein D4R74_12005 [Betaproteobacteria bacterium]